jgi:hypothetical protein
MRQIAKLSARAVRRLIPVGFWWSEATPDLPHPRKFVDSEWNSAERQAVIHYLESAYQTPVYYRGFSWCRFGCQGPNGSQDHTDRTFVFPEGFVHYIREHSVRPDDRFLEHVRSLNFRIPELRRSRLSSWLRRLGQGTAGLSRAPLNKLLKLPAAGFSQSVGLARLESW